MKAASAFAFLALLSISVASAAPQTAKPKVKHPAKSDAVPPGSAEAQRVPGGDTPPDKAAPVAPELKPDPVKSAAKSETLRFNVNWPTGLSLGEGQLTSTQSGNGWSFSFNVDAAIPAFRVSESATSTASGDLCSLELTRTGTRGKRQLEETTRFDHSALSGTRTTGKGGGKTEFRVAACPRDALTYIQYIRRELAAGRLPAPQTVYFGAGYQTRVQYVGTQQIRSGSESVEADKLLAVIKGPATDLTVEIFFARNAARTPLLAQIPVSIGKFAVEFAGP